MGNSSSNGSSSLYDCGEKAPFAGTYWTLYNGNKKDQINNNQSIDENSVSIFTLGKDSSSISVPEVLFPIANKCVQKLKLMK